MEQIFSLFNFAGNIEACMHSAV